MPVRHIVLAVALLLNAILIYSLIWGQQGVFAYRDLKQLHHDLEQRILDLDEQNVALSQEIRLLQQDEKYLEKVIRNRLNYVRQNEILYIFPEPEQTGSISQER